MMISYGKANDLLNNLKDDFIDTFETLIWKYEICKTENKITNDSEYYVCNFAVIINGTTCQIEGHGKTKKEAISASYEIGSKLIYLVIENEFIPKESYTDQLYFLYKYGFAPEPVFHFEYFPKNSNNNEELWRCYGSFLESENEFITEDFHMTDAKELASYVMLCEILGLDFEQNETTDNKTNQDFIIQPPETIIRGKGLLKHILSMYQNAA